MDGLAPGVMGDAEHGALRYGGMLGHGVLDLGGIDVPAAADDHVLDAVDDVDEAVLIHASGIAGMDPAVAQRRRRLLGLVPIAQHGVGAAHTDLAHGAA